VTNCAKCKRDEKPAFTKVFRLSGMSGGTVEHIRHLCTACAGEFADDADRQEYLETKISMPLRRKTKF